MKLNDEQQAAVDVNEGVYQVLAGPGSGKTSVIVARAQRLEKCKSLTFTREATEEMRRRGKINVQTIHSLAYQVLESHGHENPGLDQLAPQACRVLREYPHPFEYLQIDEAQDCSGDDWLFIGRLSKNIFAVGDFQQAMYRFRGSRPEMFLDMPIRFPGTQTLFLGKNYRSTKNIVSFCKQIAPRMGSMFEKMCTENEPGPPVSFSTYQNNVEEAEKTIELAESMNGSVSVLARTNQQLEVFKLLNPYPITYELSTIHAAKGKEWDNVFVVGCQEGLLPFKNGDEDEEARILFVACSRARKRLFLTGYGTPSRFLPK